MNIIFIFLFIYFIILAPTAREEKKQKTKKHNFAFYISNNTYKIHLRGRGQESRLRNEQRNKQ